jgi:hypothetical protein
MRVATDLPFVGNPDDIRVKASQAARHGVDCPAYLWKEVRPALRPDSDGWWFTREPWPFLQGVIVDAVREVADGADLETVLASAVGSEKKGVPLHPAVQRYVRHAVNAYLEVDESRQALLETTLTHREQRTIKVQHRAMQGWGVWLEDPTGSVREVRRLRHGSARGTIQVDQVWAAVMAKLAVDGRTEEATGPEPDPELVLVVEVGLGDGSDHEVFRGTAAEARRMWADVGRPVVTEMINTDDLRPGWSCTSCVWLTSCPAVPAVRGALGLPQPAAFRRSVSAADLDLYARCPAQYGMRRLFHLPAHFDDPSDAQVRGILAHQWLAAAHSRPGSKPCTEAGLPRDGADPLGMLAEHEVSLVAPFLAGHVSECPLAENGIHAIHVETRQQLFDADADVLLVAKPDLVMFRDGVETWRETKTTITEFPPSLEDLLETYTSAPFNMVLLAELSTHRTGAPAGVVEFEVLRPFEGAVYLLDVGDERLLNLARKRVVELARQWSVDVSLTATPGPSCHWCSVQRWCPSAATGLGIAAPAGVVEPDESPSVDEEIPF